MDNAPIGIFDSGIGGLSILNEIARLFPNEDLIYVSDNAHAPYGALSVEAIQERSHVIAQWFLEQHCKLVVVACNTATTNAITGLRSHFKIPFVGIEPAIKPAALHTKTGVIGVLATKGTLASDLFHQTAQTYANDIKIVEQEGKDLVSMIESGTTDGAPMEELLREYVTPMLEAEADHLVLGCTHYPFLIPCLQKILPKEVQVVDCSPAVAKQVGRILEKYQLLSSQTQKGTTRFYCTGSQKTLAQHTSTDTPIQALNR
jgi:glutamate racemase